MEIYNEKIRDLLTNSKENLIILEDIEKGVFVNDLTEQIIQSEQEVFNFINLGKKLSI